MILGLGSAGFSHGWIEMWMIMYGSLPNHHHIDTTEPRDVLVDVYGMGTEDVYSIWMEKSGETSIVGKILSTSASNVRGLFSFTDQATGEWTLKLAREGITKELSFDLLEVGVDANEIAVAVWDLPVGTQAAGTAGKVLSGIPANITTAHSTTDSNVNTQHTTTKAYIASQTTILTNILDAIKGTGYDIAIHSLVSIRENIDTVLKRIRQQNPMLEHQITRGVVTRQGRK
jgi:hypothetical protein